MKDVIEKGWGHERVWAHGGGYTGKVLHFDRAGARFSLHFHKIKHETWLVTEGRFTLITVDLSDGSRESEVLEAGAASRIPPFLPHQLIALTDGAEIVEVSTPDDPTDNYRIEPGDSQA